MWRASAGKFMDVKAFCQTAPFHSPGKLPICKSDRRFFRVFGVMDITMRAKEARVHLPY
jgi:hypothetical protein